MFTHVILYIVEATVALIRGSLAARELGHLLLTLPEIVSEDKKPTIEKRCNMFASFFLLPKSTYIEEMGSAHREEVTVEEMIDIKEQYEYIEIVVSPSNMPIAYKGTYHYRSGSTKQELKGLALQQFIMEKMGHSWDDIPVYGATLDDIDRNAIDYFLQRSIKAGRMDEEEANHSSFPRNHNIANVFYKAGFVESWGRGFKKIAEEFEKAQSKPSVNPVLHNL